MSNTVFSFNKNQPALAQRTRMNDPEAVPYQKHRRFYARRQIWAARNGGIGQTPSSIAVKQFAQIARKKSAVSLFSGPRALAIEHRRLPSRRQRLVIKEIFSGYHKVKLLS